MEEKEIKDPECEKELQPDLQEDKEQEDETVTKEDRTKEETASSKQKEDEGDAEETADSGDESEEEAQAEDDAEEKKTFFKKKDKKKDKSAELIEELNDRVRRQMAEFDNFRKRTEREKNQMFEIGAKSVIEKILPVVDSFERGLEAVPEDAKDDPYVQGMDKIYRQLITELESIGVKQIEAEGCEFNPDFHNAVMQVENEELASGTVAQVLQKGYMYRDSVVRHSMVSVVQ